MTQRRVVDAVLLAACLLAITGCSSGSDSTTTTVSPVTSIGGSTTTVPPTGTIPPPTTVPSADLSVAIVEPAALTVLPATVDLGDGRIGAEVRLVAMIDEGLEDSATAMWESDVDGPLGTGLVLETVLSNDRRDVVEHEVTVTVTSSRGEVGAASVRIVVQVPSN